MGDTRICQEEGAVPPLCWRTGEADPGDVGWESSKKQHRRCQCWGGVGGRAWAAPSLGMQGVHQHPRAEPIPAPSPPGSPARVAPTQGVEEFQHLQQ